MYVLHSSPEPDSHGLPGLGLITGGVPVGGGMHGGLNRHELNTVLILGGAASRNGAEMSRAPAGIIDIAPTILDLLGLAPSATMRGMSLIAVDGGEQPDTETHEAGAGTFRQRLTVARRGGHLFPVHGQRLAM
jgi:hypothetical protein